MCRFGKDERILQGVYGRQCNFTLGERSRFAKARAIEQHRDGGKGTFIGKRVRKQTTMAIVPEKLSIDSVYIISRSDVL